MEELLKRQVFGHLGCHADGETYVVPINFVYKDLVVYAQSGEGKKVDMMRKNSAVCLEVAEITDTFNWKSVILTGNFEEIFDKKEKQQAEQGLIDKLMPLANKPENKPAHAIESVDKDGDGKVETIVFKLLIKNRSGRFEKKDPF